MNNYRRGWINLEKKNVGQSLSPSLSKKRTQLPMIFSQNYTNGQAQPKTAIQNSPFSVPMSRYGYSSRADCAKLRLSVHQFRINGTQLVDLRLWLEVRISVHVDDHGRRLFGRRVYMLVGLRLQFH